MQSIRITNPTPRASLPSWRKSLANAVRDPDELCDLLDLPETFRSAARQSAQLFPLVVPRGFLDSIEPGNPHDPLLRQVLPLAEEKLPVKGFAVDPVGDQRARRAAGFLQKYHGRALLLVTGTCAIHCRYCFRRHYPYSQEPRSLEQWEPSLGELASDPQIHEVILSGGDPLTLTDDWLSRLADRLADIPHLQRLRIHTRLPVVLPERVEESLLAWLTSCRLQMIVVIHANHPKELGKACADALTRLVNAGLWVLNQAVLLRGVNDDAEVLTELCERLVSLRVIPYYLHQLDRVAGAAHFEVPEEKGRQLIAELRRRLPGYAVPRYVREIEGKPSKTVLC